jgi:hypothetical protein
MTGPTAGPVWIAGYHEFESASGKKRIEPYGSSNYGIFGATGGVSER